MRNTSSSVYRQVASWVAACLLVFLVTAFPRHVQMAPGSNPLYQWSFSWSSYAQNILAALTAPYHLFADKTTPGVTSDLQQMGEYIPLSLFYIAFALFGSYIFGILKGVGDVFRKDKSGYRVFRAIAWVLDAIPTFGLVVLLELGTLYARMYIKGDPISMIPNQYFFGGWIVPAILLMWAPMVYVSRLMQVSISEELGEMYVLTARSKGLIHDQVFWRHVFRNCLPKLLNEIPVVFALILSSLLAVEFLSFRWGAAFDLYVAMGHVQLGAPSLYVGPGQFDVQLVVDYLIFFALISAIVQMSTVMLRRKWGVTRDA